VSLAALAAHSCHAAAPPPAIDWGTHAAAAAAAAALAAGAPAPNPAHSPRGPAARADALCRAAGPALLRGALAVVSRDGGSREAAAALAVLLARRGALCPLPGWRAEVRAVGLGVSSPVLWHDSLHTQHGYLRRKDCVGLCHRILANQCMAEARRPLLGKPRHVQG
jgi:hypothetical protein